MHSPCSLHAKCEGEEGKLLEIAGSADGDSKAAAKEAKDREEEESDPVRVASWKPLQMDDKIGMPERIYGVVYLEKALGLLAAILPQDTNVRNSSVIGLYSSSG